MSVDTKVILISGGSGLIGKALAKSLVERGHEVRLLSRKAKKESSYSTFVWNIDAGLIDPKALQGVDVVINLAGASIVSRAWTKKRKRVLYSSRVGGNELLLKAIQSANYAVKQFIGASAIGFYGNSGDQLLDENSPAGNDYMAELCGQWEDSQWKFRAVAKQVASIRIGLVLSNEGGVLPSLNRSIIGGIGTILGSGAQYMSWIHLDDLIQAFHTLIDNPELQGSFNGVAPNPTKHKDFMRQLVNRKKGLGILIPIPGLLIEMILGKRSSLVLGGARVVPRALESHQFQFKYEHLSSALDNLVLT